MPKQSKEKTVYLVVKREYFDAIANGSKTSEYRQASPHWIDRIDDDVTDVVFQLGYGHNGQPPKRMRFKVKEVRIQDTLHDVEIPYPKRKEDIPTGFRACLIRIVLGERLM